jgi:hypothetical protein
MGFSFSKQSGEFEKPSADCQANALEEKTGSTKTKSEPRSILHFFATRSDLAFAEHLKLVDQIRIQ